LPPASQRCHDRLNRQPSTGDGAWKLVVTLDVALPSVGDRKTAEHLVQAAHKICPYSVATRGNIDVTLLIEGEPI
jgi:osmotically inducible protein OsmC